MVETTVASLIEVEGLSKSFYGNSVLRDVDFTMKYGEVLAIVGENGAGKSTLIKMLTGAYIPDSGTIKIDGEIKRIGDIKTANECGISVVFQELSLALNMSVADNIFIGNYPMDFVGFVDKKQINQQSEDLINRFNIDICATDLVQDLSIGKRQIVEILKAVSRNPKLLILDEPTSSLEGKEIKTLFQFIEELKKNGFSIIYISHFLNEIFDIANRILVLRDGDLIGIYDREELDTKSLIQLMINQDVNHFFAQDLDRSHEIGELLSTKGLTKSPHFQDVSLDLAKGEILGIAGVIGCGKDYLCRAISGDIKTESGTIVLDGEELTSREPADSLGKGIILLPENRKTQGLFLDVAVKRNIFASTIRSICKRGFISNVKIGALATKFVGMMHVKLHSLDQTIRFLSGGNQQKILLSKCMATNPKVLIAMDPTRGIDIGAKADIHRILQELAAKGLSIIVISSELDELINMCDRIVTMVGGEIVSTFQKPDFSMKAILYSMHHSNKQEKD